jgi:2-keto-4-pentenoate hydratase/2-oxohepta-3-ene-1,7-dioic acid hydratase in catechol pathway
MEKGGECIVTRYVRFRHNDRIQYGIIDGNNIEILNGNCFSEFRISGYVVNKKKVEIIAPCTPQKIICSGLNYYDTVLEDGARLPKRPLLFLKPPSSIVLSGEQIIKNKMVQILTCEAELGVVISREGKNISIKDALSYVWGYIVSNDVTAKDLQKEDIQWTRAKSFDTFLPISSEIVSGVDPSNLQIRSIINGQVMQSGNTKNMIFDIAYLISYTSHIMTLCEGDIIISGTPGGYGKIIKDGDSVTIEVEDIGAITNIVKESSEGWCLDY